MDLYKRQKELGRMGAYERCPGSKDRYLVVCPVCTKCLLLGGWFEQDRV